MPWSIVAVGLVVALACGLAVVKLTRHLPRTVGGVLAAGLVTAMILVPVALLGAAYLEPTQRLDLTEVPYETSKRCAKCHPDHYRSWSRTYHRTMTQAPHPEAIAGDFGDVRLDYNGHQTRFFREGERFYVESVDHEWERASLAGRPGVSAEPRRRTYPVDRLVGSHRQQVYLSRLDNGEFFILPFLWNLEDEAWRPMGAVFVNPDAEGTNPGYDTPWNKSCIFCHNTRPNPGLRKGFAGGEVGWDDHLEEMGIACEACHGPGEEHIQANTSLMRRQLLIETGRRDPTIVNAARLKQQGSLFACGRCHGKWVPKQELQHQVLTRGDLFVPGRRDLTDVYLLPMVKDRPYDPERDRNYFWPDGSPRATALEFQGTLLSPCTQRGEMTCLSCHSMHASDPKDQLRFPEDPATPELESNEQCLQCHPQFRGDSTLVAHTRHPRDSAGSECASCHMPYQTYGILRAHRAHRIQNPDPRATATDSIPNACNQCHVDRSLSWTRDVLAKWEAGDAPPSVQPDPEGLYAGDRSQVSETLFQAASGHALSRAIAVQMLGSPLGLEAAPGRWRVPFLIDALEDPYAVVRLNALRSLRALPGFEDLEYDYYADPEVRARQIARARTLWARVAPPSSADLPAAIPLHPDGRPVEEVRSRLRASRDDTVLMIQE